MIVQLNPCIPVFVVDKGTGEALAWFDYSQEHDLMWLVALDESGECWIVPNKDVRLLQNYSVGRLLKQKKP